MNHTTGTHNENVQWLEVSISLYGYAFPRNEDGTPFTFASYSDALRDHEADKTQHNASLVPGLSEDDEYEYELHPVIIQNDKISILSSINLTDVIETFNC